jgi:hypothetical protein
MVVWRLNSGEPKLQSAFFDGSAWSMSDIVSETEDAYDYQVALNDSDNAFAIWQADNAIQTAYFDEGTWSSSEIVSEVAGMVPQISLNNSGKAFAVWLYLNIHPYLQEAAVLVQVAGFGTSSAPNDPQDLLGIRKANKFVFQTDFYN